MLMLGQESHLPSGGAATCACGGAFIDFDLWSPIFCTIEEYKRALPLWPYVMRSWLAWPTVAPLTQTWDACKATLLSVTSGSMILAIYGHVCIMPPLTRWGHATATLIYPHIDVSRAGVPYITGTQTKVVEIVLGRLASYWDAGEIRRQHPHFSLVQIHSALVNYYDHQAEMD